VYFQIFFVPPACVFLLAQEYVWLYEIFQQNQWVMLFMNGISAFGLDVEKIEVIFHALHKVLEKIVFFLDIIGGSHRQSRLGAESIS
jgi:hypothetical protein